MLNPIFSKKVQGQKHHGRWGTVEHQIPSIKMFKTNTNSHKHPNIRVLSKSKTQLVNQRKQKVAFSPGTAHSPRTWWSAASPILNDSPIVYTTYNRTSIKNVHIYIYIYINTELLDGNQGHQEETHRPTHRFRRLFLDLLSMGWREDWWSSWNTLGLYRMVIKTRRRTSEWLKLTAFLGQRTAKSI